MLHESDLLLVNAIDQFVEEGILAICGFNQYTAQMVVNYVEGAFVWTSSASVDHDLDVY